MHKRSLILVFTLGVALPANASLQCAISYEEYRPKLIERKWKPISCKSMGMVGNNWEEMCKVDKDNKSNLDVAHWQNPDNKSHLIFPVNFSNPNDPCMIPYFMNKQEKDEFNKALD